MSSFNLHFPQHHPFSSTLTDHRGRHHASFNMFIVILTALFFFTVLVWFNFVLAFYSTITTCDPNHVDATMSNLGFALIWTVITIAIYYAMDWANVLDSESMDGSHPLLRGEGSRVDTRVDTISSLGRVDPYVGGIDISAI